jgi:hypothetical protein
MVHALWANQAQTEMIRDRIAIKAARTRCQYLGCWDVSMQPMKQADEQSSAPVGQWSAEQYPVIAGCTKVETAKIHWGDETSPRSEDMRGGRDAPQGQVPVIQAKHKRHELAVIAMPGQ